MDKNEFLELLKDNLSIKIEREKVEGNYYQYTGEQRLKIVLEFDGNEICSERISKKDIDFILDSK